MDNLNHIICSNNPPIIYDQNNTAVWKRVRVIPFQMTWVSADKEIKMEKTRTPENLNENKLNKN